MIHITENKTGKIIDFITLGNFWNDNHHKSLKDTLELFDFHTFGDKRFSEHLSKMNRIIIPDEDGTNIEFIIDNVVKYRSSKQLVAEVYTSASYLQLKKAKVIRPQKLESISGEQGLEFALSGTEFKPGIVESDATRTIDIENYTNPYALIKRLATELDLEPRFRIEDDGNKVTGRYVDLLDRVGEWRGREVEFGKDLMGIQRKEDTSNIVTALIGLGPEREDGTRLEVFVEDEDALQRWGRPNPDTGELMHLVEVYEPQSTDAEMTEGRLTELTQNELEKRVNAVVEYTGDIADLENVPGMENKKIRFGDTIKIKDTGFNPPLYLEARVHTQDRSLSDKSQKKVTLGDYIEYTEEEVNAIWKSLQKEIQDRLSRIAIVNIVSSAGTVFKNGIGETELKAVVYQNGEEVDLDGRIYHYQWEVLDKDGKRLKFITDKQHIVRASEVDEKITYIVTVSREGQNMSSAVITITNVNDGEDGEQGPQGPQGPKGDKGDRGVGINTIVEYYLATNASSGITRGTNGWTTEVQMINSSKKYLWNYEMIIYTDGTVEYTDPVIIGTYGEKGDKGSDGRSLESITEYYLATSQSSGVTRDTDGWSTVMQPLSNDKKYLWNYEEIRYKNPSGVEYTEPVIIGVYGDKGDRGPQGPAGTSVSSITEYYLATNQSSGVTTGTTGWTTTMQQMTASKKYLWNYERINFSDGTYQNTNPVIIGIYGEKGDTGEEGRSITGITEYYLATNASSGVTRSTSGWTTSMQVTTPEKKYLWNYEKITWNKAPLETYTDPVIIGVHGEKGDRGPQGIQGPPGKDGQSQYVHIRYSPNSNGNPMTTTPQSDSKYIGLAVTTSPTAPSSYTAYSWARMRGEDGVPGPPGEDGQPTYTWVKYADNENGSGMSDSPDGKMYIGLAFNKTTPEESNNPADYTWSLMPQNIEIGGRNFIRDSDKFLPGNSGSTFPTTQDIIDFLNESDYVTASVYIEVKNAQPSGNNRIGYELGLIYEDGSLGTINVWVYPKTGENIKGRFSNTFDLRNSKKVVALRHHGIYIQTGGDFLKVGRPKLEKGNKATDWTPAPEDVQEQIDDAKNTAEEAKTAALGAQETADGKNTVFYQPTSPTPKAVNDIWFKTDEGFKMHRAAEVGGSLVWVESRFSSAAFSTIDAGKITVGVLKGIRIEGVEIVGANYTTSGDRGTVDIKDDRVYFYYHSPYVNYSKELEITSDGISLKDNSNFREGLLSPAELRLSEVDVDIRIDTALNYGKPVISSSKNIEVKSGTYKYNFGTNGVLQVGDVRITNQHLYMTNNITLRSLSDGWYLYNNWGSGSNTYVRQNKDGAFFVVVGGSTKHSLYAGGTKSGGSIEIDGVNLGMSPIDSPQILIETIEFDIPLTENGTKVYLDNRFAKSVNHRFAVFPNNGKVIEKGEDYFVIAGEGFADVRIIGERIGYEDVYYDDIDAQEEGILNDGLDEAETTD